MEKNINESNLTKIIRATAVIIGIIYFISAATVIPSLFSAIIGIFGGKIIYTLLYFIAKALKFISALVVAAAFALYGIRRIKGSETTKSLFLAVASASVIRIVASVLHPVIIGLANLSRHHHFYPVYGGMLGDIVLIIVSVVAIYALTYLDEEPLFIGTNIDEIKTLFMKLPEMLQKEMENLAEEYKEKKGVEKDMDDNGTVLNDIDENAERAKDNYSTLKYYLFSLITCGIYQLYIIHSLSKNANIMCAGDGKNTSGLLKFFLLSLITCGIYSFVWFYKYMKRIGENIDRYGADKKTFASMELGPCWLILTLVGALITACGIGVIIEIYAMYLLFTNTNTLAKAYNENLEARMEYSKHVSEQNNENENESSADEEDM